MDHLENVNPPTRSLDDLGLAQIIEGSCDETCSVHVFLANMPGEMKCHQVAQPEGKEQLLVFCYPESVPDLVQQKIMSVLTSLPESGSRIFDMVQYWAPGDGYALSVSKQPFRVDRICNGVCRYRYLSVMNEGLVSESDPVGKTFTHHQPGLFMNVGADYSESQQRSLAKWCGFKGSWVIPLVRDHGMFFPPVCVGVLEFLIGGEVTVDYTLEEKFQKLTEHVIGVLNSPSDMGNYSSPLGFRHFVYPQANPQGETRDVRNAPSSQRGFEHIIVPFVDSSNIPHQLDFADQIIYQAHHGDFSLAESSSSFPIPIFDIQNSQTYYDGLSSSLSDHTHTQYQHGSSFASSSITDAHITEDDEQPLEAPTGENHPKDMSVTSKGTRTAGKLNISKAMIVAQYGKNMEDAARTLGVHKSTLKRYCRSFGIGRWPSHKRNNKFHHLQDMSVKATYGKFKVKFKIEGDIDIGALYLELGRRFGLEVGSFRIQYKEDGGDVITITCTEDLWEHINSLSSSKQETMHLLLSPPN